MTTSNELVLLNDTFTILPLGILLKENAQPPTELEFETLLYHLAVKQDELRWQIAAACNLYNRFYRSNAYLKAANILSISPETVETYAYIERNVPYEVRRSEKTIWFHKLVAKLKPDLQAEYLDYCIQHDMSHSIFEQWLIKQQNANIPPVTYRSDRLYELEQENYNLVTENSDLKTQLAKVEPSQLNNKNDNYALIIENVIKTIDALAEVYPQGIVTIKDYLETYYRFA